MLKLLVTGGAGFIGSNFVRRHLAAHPDHTVLVLDSLGYAGNLANLTIEAEHGRRINLDEKYPGYRFMKGDIADRADVDAAFDELKLVDAVVHFAAESHVDRSIDDATPFVRTNVLGTQVLLEAARRRGVARFLHVSTDEVYGSLSATDPAFTEETPLAPNSPYAASKAGSDCLARSYFHTFKLPVVITRCSNNYGPYQFPEKFIPLFITNALEDQPLPIYGDGKQVRDWVHVDDHCDALETVLWKGSEGAVYNIGGQCERANIDIARSILAATGKTDALFRHVKDRLGHARRYAMNIDLIGKRLKWQPTRSFDEELPRLVRWYQENRGWWTSIKSGEYRDYYQKMYGARLASG